MHYDECAIAMMTRMDCMGRMGRMRRTRRGDGERTDGEGDARIVLFFFVES
jgi:hypothetical protein